MIRLAIIFLAFAAPLRADTLPAPLAAQLADGLRACLLYYESGNTPMQILGANGQTIKGKTAEASVSLAGTKRRIFVRTIIEGAGDRECEVHTNYDRGELRKDGFALVMQTLTAQGYTATLKQHWNNQGKSVLQKGPVKTNMMVRVRAGKLQLKLKKFPGGSG